MCTGKKRIFQVGIRSRSTQGKECAAPFGHLLAKTALLLVFVFAFSMPLANGATASSQSVILNEKNIDARWLPWVGSWRLVSDTEETADSAVKDQYLLTTSPGDNEKSILMEGHRAGQVLFEERIEADGVRRSMEKDGCTGWQQYGWSETGKRLLFQGESDCTGNLRQEISGLSIIEGSGDWLDVQLVQSEEGKAVTIRRYRSVDAGVFAPGQTRADPARVARVSAGTDFSIDEIIELSGKVEPEVLEAALIELHKPFPVNSKQILRMADSDVPTRIVDLVVALSFPDQFIVEQSTIYRVQKLRPMQAHLDVCPSGCYWPCAHPMFFGLCAASIYSYYDSWYLDRYYWPGWYHYSWWYPVYDGGDYGVNAGRLDKEQGYTQVYPDNGTSTVRYAIPRNAPAGQGAASQQVYGYPSSNSTSAYSSGSSTGSASSSPAASPGGYSSGGSSSGTAASSDFDE